jgi:nitrogen fixation NifU-like protein
MADKSPYDDLIMDHIKNARHYFVSSDANRKATGTNPLCGDDLTVYLKVVNDTIKEISFQCSCCGISMASASIMTEMIKGLTTRDVTIQLQTFLPALRNRTTYPMHISRREQLALLATVQKFPSRSECAALPWSTLERALSEAPLFDC